MNRIEYRTYFCHECCKKCDGSEYSQKHCTDLDILDGAWEACTDHFIEKSSKWIDNLMFAGGYDAIDRQGNLEDFKEEMEDDE